MSRENVEVARGSFEHFNRHGFLNERFFDPEIELSNLRESPIPGPYVGYEGLRKWRDDLKDVIADWHFQLEEVVDADEADAVAVRLRLRGRARHTDIDVDVPFTVVTWHRDGRIYRSVGFSSHDEALEAVGLAG